MNCMLRNRSVIKGKALSFKLLNNLFIKMHNSESLTIFVQSQRRQTWHLGAINASELMSSRLRNLLFAFGLSIVMWVAIIQASISIYHVALPNLDRILTASTTQSVETGNGAHAAVAERLANSHIIMSAADLIIRLWQDKFVSELSMQISNGQQSLCKD